MECVVLVTFSTSDGGADDGFAIMIVFTLINTCETNLIVHPGESGTFILTP